MNPFLPIIFILSLVVSSCQAPSVTIPASSDRPLDAIQEVISETYRLTFTDRILTRLNGEPLHIEAQRDQGQLLLPLRPLLEACGAGLDWDGQVLTVYLYDNVLTLYESSPDMLVNGNPTALPQPITNQEGQLVGPVRPICEALSIGVAWSEESRTLDLSAPLPQDRQALALKGRTIALGDSMLSVQTRWGQPDRVDPSVYDFNWHVYNRDYRNFVMVGYRGNEVCAIYSNAAGFTALGHAWGTPPPLDSDTVRFYADDHAGGTIHAVLMGTGFNLHETVIPDPNPDLMAAQERESMDLANSFRVANGLAPLFWGDLLNQSARSHSQDMADRQYFSHTNPEGLQPWDRYRNMGGVYTKFGENIYAGHFTALDTHHGWINSASHREAILDPAFTHMGVGMAYTPATEYYYYTTQHFLR